MSEIKDKLSTEQGQTEPKDQVSKETGQNDPPSGGKVFDLTEKIILNPNRPYEVLTGEQIRNAVGRGKLLDETQSKLQKMESEYAKTQTDLETYKQRVDLMETNRRVADLESRSLSDNDLDKDVFGFADDKAVSSEKVIRQTIEPEMKETKTKMSQLEKEIVELKQYREAQAIETELKQFGQAEQKMRKSELKTEYPVLSEDETDEILEAENISRGLDRQAEANVTKDIDLAKQFIAESTQYRNKALSLRLDAMRKQERENTRNKAKKELETLSTVESQKSEISVTREGNPAKAKLTNAQIIESAKKKSKEFDRLRQNVP